jgi:hypothetical protein
MYSKVTDVDEIVNLLLQDMLLSPSSNLCHCLVKTNRETRDELDTC